MYAFIDSWLYVDPPSFMFLSNTKGGLKNLIHLSILYPADIASMSSADSALLSLESLNKAKPLRSQPYKRNTAAVKDVHTRVL